MAPSPSAYCRQAAPTAAARSKRFRSAASSVSISSSAAGAGAGPKVSASPSDAGLSGDAGDSAARGEALGDFGDAETPAALPVAGSKNSYSVGSAPAFLMTRAKVFVSPMTTPSNCTCFVDTEGTTFLVVQTMGTSKGPVDASRGRASKMSSSTCGVKAMSMAQDVPADMRPGLPAEGSLRRTGSARARPDVPRASTRAEARDAAPRRRRSRRSPRWRPAAAGA